jgi:hypothetical protein
MAVPGSAGAPASNWGVALVSMQGKAGVGHPVSIVSDRAVDPAVAVVERLAVDAGPVQTVPITRLEVSDTPRLNGVDPERVQALAESGADLPPILVHCPTKGPAVE